MKAVAKLSFQIMKNQTNTAMRFIHCWEEMVIPELEEWETAISAEMSKAN
jgi:hypothetical protein